MIAVPCWIIELIEPGCDHELVVYEWAAMERDVADLGEAFARLDFVVEVTQPLLYELLYIDLELQRHYGDLFAQLDVHLGARWS